MENFSLTDGVGKLIAGLEIQDLIITKSKSVVIENCTIHGKVYVDDCSIVKVRNSTFLSKDISLLSTDGIDIQHCNFYLTGNKPLIVSRCENFGLIHSYIEVSKAGLHILETTGISFETNTIYLRDNIDIFALISHSKELNIQSNVFKDNFCQKNSAYRFQECDGIRHGGDEMGNSLDTACIYEQCNNIISEYNKFIDVKCCTKFKHCSNITVDALTIAKANNIAIELDNVTNGFIRDCKIDSSRIAGIIAKNSKKLDLRNCTIRSCIGNPIPRKPKSNFYKLLGIDTYRSYLEGSSAIYSENTEDLSIFECEISNSESGIILKNAVRPKVNYNMLENIHTGVVVYDTLLAEVKYNSIQSQYAGVIIIKDNTEVKSGVNELRSNDIQSDNVDIYCSIETDDNIVIDNSVKSIVSMSKNNYYAQSLLNEYDYKVYLNRLDTSKNTLDKESIIKGNLIVPKNDDIYDEINVQLRLLYKRVINYLNNSL